MSQNIDGNLFCTVTFKIHHFPDYIIDPHAVFTFLTIQRALNIHAIYKDIYKVPFIHIFYKSIYQNHFNNQVYTFLIAVKSGILPFIRSLLLPTSIYTAFRLFYHH